ncbi:hypothetical protein Rt10032_c04g2127 [Rhodotorula toruloides]|uniref:Uncharacterized protein n=1 Tax=Rhodotorula toruloides TaxID=5286 RepID=A0A511KCK3_RHOTO|nr:hypothetical protein Rt10032_c04g2127 [Rhodotorula toruloides]
MKDKGLLWRVGGKDGVDAPHTWKGISALRNVATSPYIPLRHFILELLLLNLEKQEKSSLRLTPSNSCLPLAEWALTAARKFVDSRAQSAAKARKLLSLTDDGSAASWIDANLPPCPTPDEQLTGWKELPPPSALPVLNEAVQHVKDEVRTPPPPVKLDLPVVKVVPPTPRTAVRAVNLVDETGPAPPIFIQGDSTKTSQPSSHEAEVSLRFTTPLDRACSVEKGKIRLSFSSDLEAEETNVTAELQHVADDLPPNSALEALPLPSNRSPLISKPSPPPLAPSPATPTAASRVRAGPVRLYLTNLPLDTIGSNLRNFLPSNLGVEYLAQPRILPDGATGLKQAWVTVADCDIAARAADITKDKVVGWNGLRVTARVVSIDEGLQKGGKSFGFAPKRAGPTVKREPPEADFARSQPAWHRASPELERKPGLLDRKILLNIDGDGFAEVKVEDADVEMADEEEAKPSPPQDLPFSLPFLASTFAATAAAHSTSYTSPSPTPPPSHFSAGYSAPENPYRARSPVHRSRPYHSSPPPPHRISPALCRSKLSHELLKGEEGFTPCPSHPSPYPSPELSPPPDLPAVCRTTASIAVPWATSPVLPSHAVADDVGDNPFAALFASSISPGAPSVHSSPVPPSHRPVLRSALKRSASAYEGAGGRDAKRRRMERSVHWAEEIAVVVGFGAGHAAEVEEAGGEAEKQQPVGVGREKRVRAGLRW